LDLKTNFSSSHKATAAKVPYCKDRSFVLFEVVKGALNRKTSKVDVVLKKKADSNRALLSVKADSADAFAELRTAFVHFCTNKHLNNGKSRDRVKNNRSEIYAMCDGIHIHSTRGSMAFDRNGGIANTPKTELGSLFSASVLLSENEIDQGFEWIRRLIVPAHITLTINAVEVPARKPVVRIESCPLQTEISDELGLLKRVTMPALVEVYKPNSDEFPTLFEMGVPVAAASFSHHINVSQVIPMTYDGTSIPSAYTARLNSQVMQAMERASASA
jgi:hypothetical protein